MSWPSNGIFGSSDRLSLSGTTSETRILVRSCPKLLRKFLSELSFYGELFIAISALTYSLVSILIFRFSFVTVFELAGSSGAAALINFVVLTLCAKSAL